MNFVKSLSPLSYTFNAFLISWAFTVSSSWPFIMAALSSWSISAYWLRSCINFVQKSFSLSFNGVPLTRCCVLSSLTVISPFSITIGNCKLISSMNICATLVESTVPWKANWPWTTSHESKSISESAWSVFRYNFLPSKLETLDVPCILKELAHDVNTISVRSA